MSPEPAIRIRAERAGDAAALRSLHEAAFGRTAEADIVDALRRDPAPPVALLAEDAAGVVGHIVFSAVADTGAPGVRLMGLGPMAVCPHRQNEGIGSALVRRGLAACAEAAIDGVVVLGHPGFYPRFGFVPASRHGIRSRYAVPDEVFMALELRAGGLTARSGPVRYHRAFDA